MPAASHPCPNPGRSSLALTLAPARAHTTTPHKSTTNVLSLDAWVDVLLQAYLLGFLLDWRTVCWACSLDPLLLLLAMWGVRETPYWLVEHGREAEARAALQWYRGPKYNIDQEIGEIVDSKRRKEKEVAEGGGAEGVLGRMLTPAFLKPLACAGVLYLLAQWTGISTMVFYMTNIFQVRQL